MRVWYLRLRISCGFLLEGSFLVLLRAAGVALKWCPHVRGGDEVPWFVVAIECTLPHGQRALHRRGEMSRLKGCSRYNNCGQNYSKKHSCYGFGLQKRVMVKKKIVISPRNCPHRFPSDGTWMRGSSADCCATLRAWKVAVRTGLL